MITDRKQAELEPAHRARHDPLTGLPTRRRSSSCSPRSPRRSAGPDSPFAALFVDLDRFKVINDSLGHDASDEVLTVVRTPVLAAIPARRDRAVRRGRIRGGPVARASATPGRTAARRDTPVDPVDIAHRSAARPAAPGDGRWP